MTDHTDAQTPDSLQADELREQIAQICKLHGVPESAYWNIADQAVSLFTSQLERREAETTFEGYTDTIGALFMLYGGVGDVLRGLKIYKDYSTTMNTETVEFQPAKGSKVTIGSKEAE